MLAASALTSMCSLVTSQGRCASSLLISLRFRSFWGAQCSPRSHAGLPPTCRNSPMCKPTR